MSSQLSVLAADTNVLLMGVFLLVAFFALVFLIVFFRYFGLWIQCVTTRAGVSLGNLLMMSLRKVSPTIIVRSKIMAVQSGVTRSYPISTKALEAHYLAGGNVPNVIRALIAAHRAGLTQLDWQTAAAIDLAGRDLLDAIRTSVYPKVIDCPDPKRGTTLDAVSKDGIQLKVRARVTVRTNIKQLVGGATEETVIARVGQGIVQAIGSTPSYKDVLANPDSISRTVLGEGLEAQTAFEIVSIDIADVDVGENIGARLQADQAEAQVRVAQAKAEEQRANAMAAEQEMIALIQENRAKVVMAEALIPMAIAESLNSGKLTLMDYYELRNVQADTRMRETIAGADAGSAKT